MLLSHGEEEDILYTSSRPAALGGRRFASGAEYIGSYPPLSTSLVPLPKKTMVGHLDCCSSWCSGVAIVCMSKGPGSKMSGQRG